MSSRGLASSTFAVESGESDPLYEALCFGDIHVGDRARALAAELGGALARSIHRRATRRCYGTQTSIVSKTPSELRCSSGKHSSFSAHRGSPGSHLGKHWLSSSVVQTHAVGSRQSS